MTEPKSFSVRSLHARELLAAESDAWVSSASASGDPYLIPLTYHWDGQSMLFSTPEASRTARNLRRNNSTRVSLPGTRDVVILDGTVRFIDPQLNAERIDNFVVQHGWDPRLEPNLYAFFTFTPDQVQAWSVASELPTRVVMRDGRWIEGTGQP